jgi:Transglycosylase SLT domain
MRGGYPSIMTPQARPSRGRLVLASCVAVLVVGLTTAAPGGLAGNGPPENTSVPTVAGLARVGTIVHGLTGRWSGAPPIRFSFRWMRCDRAGRRCSRLPHRNSRSLTVTPTLAGTTLRLTVIARNPVGASVKTSAQTAVVLASGSSGAAVAPGMYFSMLQAGSAVPRTDALCASVVTPRSFEPRPENTAANHTVPTVAVPWPQERDQTYWRKWIANRNKVTGNYTGTTDEIIRWASCKWGLDEDTVRAVAVQESEWHQSEVGDNNSSFGIMQVKDHTSDGHPDLGGYPWTLQATALNVDLYGSWIRSCLNGAFYDGGDWLYHGRKVVNDLWGCVGAWFSGDWHDRGANTYISQVRAILAGRGWLHLQPGP